MKIGVLAMQGAFEEHVKVLESLGIEALTVRRREQLQDIDGLIIPGGESTTIGKMLNRYDLMEPLKEMISKGFPVFGTCAGLIMLSDGIEGGIENQPLLGGLDVLCIRNAYGRQVDSFEAEVTAPFPGEKPFPGVFIRAPLIKWIGDKVKIIGKFVDDVVAVRQENILAVSFHPELAGDTRFHEYFINMIRERMKKND